MERTATLSIDEPDAAHPQYHDAAEGFFTPTARNPSLNGGAGVNFRLANQSAQS
jgi:hypothetical protein